MTNLVEKSDIRPFSTYRIKKSERHPRIAEDFDDMGDDNQTIRTEQVRPNIYSNAQVKRK